MAHFLLFDPYLSILSLVNKFYSIILEFSLKRMQSQKKKIKIKLKKNLKQLAHGKI